MSESRSDSKSTRMGRWGVVITLLLLLCVSQGTARAQQTSSTKPGSPSKLPLGNIEDWSSLSLEHSELVAERPLLGERDQNDPQFVRELWQLKWRQGDPIDLYVIRPKGIAKPPAILYLYSYPSESDVFRNDAYCERITSGGFAAIGFVSALTGHRYVNRPMKEWFVSELQEALASSVHDVQLILNYLATRGDLDMERIGMFGVGSGGTITILSAAVDLRLKAIDVIDPWGDWPNWMAESSIIPEVERPNCVKPEFLKKVAPLDPVEWLPRLKTQHVRLQQVMADSVTPRSVQEHLKAAAPATMQVATFDNTTQLAKAGSKDNLLRWIKAQLRTDATQAVVQNSRKYPRGKQSLDSNHDE